jgi:hypothetical protein
MSKNMPGLPAECAVTLVLEARCTIKGCSWATQVTSSYSECPSVKRRYFTHLELAHPNYSVTVRNHSATLAPTDYRVVREQIAALL